MEFKFTGDTVPLEAHYAIGKVLHDAGLGWGGCGPSGTYVYQYGRVVGIIGDYETRHDLEHAIDLAQRAKAGTLKAIF